MTLDKFLTALDLSLGTAGSLGILVRVLTRSKRDTVRAAAMVFGSGQPRGGLVPPSPLVLEAAAAAWADAVVGAAFVGSGFFLQFLGLIVPDTPVSSETIIVVLLLAMTFMIAAVVACVSRWLTKHRFRSLVAWYKSQPVADPHESCSPTIWVDES